MNTLSPFEAINKAAFSRRAFVRKALAPLSPRNLHRDVAGTGLPGYIPRHCANPKNPFLKPMQQFESFRASSLYCNKCRQAMPVREKLLLILPDKEIFDYLCTGCASSLGQREVTEGDLKRRPGFPLVSRG